MTVSVTHAFVNPKADGGDTTITRPSDWNAEHVVTGIAEPTPNLIINGGMEVSQEKVATAQTGITTAGYIVDMFGWQAAGAGVYTLQQSTDSPDYFSKSAVADVTTADASLAATDRASIYTWIEGYKAAHLEFGTSAAKSISLAFWVKAFRAATYSGAIVNAAANRSYPFSFTVNASETWEYKTVTIPGDTTGTWDTTNGTGIRIYWTLAAGSTFVGTADTWAASDLRGVTGTVNGIAATTDIFRISGVSVVAGSTPRPQEMARPGAFDQELLSCMRYYEKSFEYATVPVQNAGVETGEWTMGALVAGAAANRNGAFKYLVRKRAAATITTYNPSVANANARDLTVGVDCSAPSFSTGTESGARVVITGNASTGISSALAFHWTASARL